MLLIDENARKFRNDTNDYMLITLKKFKLWMSENHRGENQNFDICRN